MPVVIPGSVTSPAQTANSGISSAIGRLAASGDPQAAALAAQLSSQFGVTQGSTGGSSLSLGDQVKKAAGDVANFAAPVLNVLNRPSQAILHTLQGFSGQGANILNPNVIGNAFESGAQALVGQQPDINLRQAVLGNDQGNNELGLGLGGLPAGLLDTVGGGAIDPTTYFGGDAVKALGKGVGAGAGVVGNTAAGAAIKDFAAPALANVADKLTPLRNALVPGAELGGAIGPEAGAATSTAIQGAEAQGAQASGDVFNKLDALTKQSGVTSDEIQHTIIPALENGTAPQLVASLTAAGDTAKASLISSIHDLLPTTSRVVNSFMPQDFLSRTAERQIPLELTKQGAKAFANNPQAIADALGVDLKDVNTALAPHVGTGTLPGINNIGDIETKLQTTGLVKPGQAFLNHDVINLAATQGAKQAQTKAETDLLGHLATQTDNEGNKLVMGANQEAEAATKGYVGHVMADGTKAYVHPAVNKAMHDVSTVINDDKTVTAFDGALKQMTRLWKGYAVLHAGFHTQNEIGNVFMNTVAGMRSPSDLKYYAKAARLQKIMAVAAHSGEDFNEALSKVKGISAKDIEYINAARKEHVTDSSYFSANQAVRQPIQSNETHGSFLGRMVKKFDPFDTENIFLHTNKVVGTAMEHNSRLAHFMWQLDKTGSADTARESVNKFLFNYNELTPIERKRIQAVLPFYTYMRKNTPMQLKLLAEHPGFYANYGKLQQNLQQDGPDDGTQYDPSKLANGAFPVQLPGMSSPVLASPQSPLYAAFSQLQPLGDLASLIPGSPNKGQVSNAGQSLAQGLLSPVGGFAGGLAKYAAEEATGKNVGTGATIKPGTNLSLLASTVMPTAGLANSTLNAAQTGNGATLLRNLAGLPVYQGGQNATNGTLAGRLAAVQGALASLQGSIGAAKLPTTSILRKEGKITTTIKKRKRAPSRKTHHKRL